LYGGGGAGGPPGDDFDASGIAERFEELLAVLPGQAESADVSHAQTGDDIAEALVALGGEIGGHHCVLSPIHEAGERQAVVKVRADLIGDGFAGDGHDYRVFRCPLSRGYFS